MLLFDKILYLILWLFYKFSNKYTEILYTTFNLYFNPINLNIQTINENNIQEINDSIKPVI